MKLFHGHPDLIQGFEEWILRGYRIDSGMAEDQAVEDQAVEDEAVEDPEAVRKLNLDDALDYVDQVKACFKDRPEVNKQFLHTLKDWQSHSIELFEVVTRVHDLFHGHPDLIQGFGRFLPPGYSRESEEGEDQADEEHSVEDHVVEGPEAGQNPNWSGALSFLDEVISRFQDMPDVKDRFLYIMEDWKVQDTPIPTLVACVLDLFHTQHDLVRKFNVFLPPGYAIECGLVEDPKAFRLTYPGGTTAWSLRDSSGDHFFIGH